jgi:Phasin protein
MHFLKKFFDAANQSAEAVNRQIIRITQRNLNAGLDLTKSLASARDPFEIAKLQASFWWKQFNEFSTQAEEVHKRLFGFGAVPEPTPEPDLRAPAQESLTSPQPEHRLAAQDPAIPRAKQKPAKQKVETPTLAAQTRKTAESDVGRAKSGLRRSTAEKRSAQPTSTFRHSARKQGERKPQATRTPTRQIVRADAARPHERQSGTPKKGAPQERAPQVLPMGVKFGMLDGNAVRFTNFEAWWLVDGAWRPVSPGEVLSNAAVMREARFKEVFPQVPILPRKAFQSDRRGES